MTTELGIRVEEDRHEAVKFFDPSLGADRIDLNPDSSSLDDSIESSPTMPNPTTDASGASALPGLLRLAPHLAAQIQAVTAQLTPSASSAACKANNTRVRRLWDRSGLSEVAFADLMQLASERTLARVRQPRGRPIGNPISYFFTVLERLLVAALDPVPAPVLGDSVPGSDGGSPPAPIPGPVATPAGASGVFGPPARPPASAPAAAGPTPCDADRHAAPPSEAPASLDPRLWQQVLIRARCSLPANDYSRILRYALLLDLDLATGRALVGVPTDYMRAEIAGRLAAPLGAILGQVYGQSLQIVAAILPGAGRLGGPLPRLPTLAARIAPEGESSFAVCSVG